jgi:hypothetical protein
MIDLPQARFERWLRERDVSWSEFLLMPEAQKCAVIRGWTCEAESVEPDGGKIVPEAVTGSYARFVRWGDRVCHALLWWVIAPLALAGFIAQILGYRG